MFGWFKVKSPITADQRRWVETRFDWLRGQFGDERLRGAVVTPTDAFFPDRYAETEEDAGVLFDRVCQYMGVDRGRIDLRFYTTRAANDMAAAYDPALQLGYAAGAFVDHQERIDIWLEASNLHEAAAVVATLAHELGHVHLLADGRCNVDIEDHEPLTDLLVVYFGLGLFAANSVIQESHWRAGNVSGWRVSKLGYMSVPEYAYAPALYAYHRGEHSPSWAVYLRKDVRSLFQADLKELITGSLPANATEPLPADDDELADGADEPIEEDQRQDADDGELEQNEPMIEGQAECTIDRPAADELFTEGTCLADRGDHEQAVAAFSKSLKHNPRDEEVWLQLARSQLAIGEFAAAVESSTRALQIEPDEVSHRCVRAAAQICLKQFDAAERDTDAAIRSHWKEPEPYMLRGIARIGMGRCKEAVSDLTKAIRYAPTWAESYLARSRAYAGLGKTRKAEADLNEAIRRDPDMADESCRAATLAGRI